MVDEDDGKTYHSLVVWTTPSSGGAFPVSLAQLQAYEHRNSGMPLNMSLVLGFNNTDGKSIEELERAVGRAVMNLAAEVNGLEYEPLPLTLVPESDDGEDRS